MSINTKIVESKVYSVNELFLEKYEVDFYQREYVWQIKQINDLITDLTNEFLKYYNIGDSYESVKGYDPYYMGEIVLAIKSEGHNAVIDGQQRITSITLLLIYLIQNFQSVNNFPKGDLEKLIYSNDFGTKKFNLEIPERKECMLSLFNTGDYTVKNDDSVSVKNINERFKNISECWNEAINKDNIVHFAYWIMAKVKFSKVWTNSDEFAYVIFETMNDRGLSLTQVEMLRSYLLANIDEDSRILAMASFDEVIRLLINIKLSSKSKAEFEFFKIYFRSHYAKDMSQSKNSNSDFSRIGKEFHRWVRDNEKSLNLNCSSNFIDFISRIRYFASVYNKINSIIASRNTREYLYLIVNSDYNFTLQPALIIASINYGDNDQLVDKKIKLVTKYLTKILSWRVWNHWLISQSSLEAPIYDLCKKIRNRTYDEIVHILNSDPISSPSLDSFPILNRQNGPKIKVLLSLITEIVAIGSGTPDYMLNKKDSIEIEHIWSDHYYLYEDECNDENEFNNVRNSIGDLLVLPKSFNASYGDNSYEDKVKHYYGQNILAQSLYTKKYQNNPGFTDYIEHNNLLFKPYDVFNKEAINERAELYKQILLHNWE